MKRKFTILFVTFFLTASYFNLNAQCVGDTISMYSGLLDYIDGMGVSENGHVVTAHMMGITIYDGTSWTKHNVPDAHQISGIDIDDEGKVYIAISYEGFMVWENSTTFTKYDTSDGLHSMETEVVKVAPDGKVWIGSWGFGCSYFDGSSFTKFDTLTGLSDNNIVGFDFDDQGNVYMAGYNGSITIYDGTNFKTLTPPNVDEVIDIAVDRNGGLWVSAFSFVGSTFLLHYDGSKWNNFNYPTQHHVFTIESDLSGNVLCGTFNGLTKFDGKRWKVYTTSDGLYENYAYEIGIDGFDQVWISGNTGLSLLSEYSALKGTIYDNVSYVSSGYVKLFKKTNGVKKIIQYDSVAITGLGDYDFSNVPLGMYVIYAEGDPALYGSFAGAYFGDVELWSSAEEVRVAFCDTIYSALDIELIEKLIDPPGKGYISGHIKSADGTRAGSEPIKDVDVTLKKVPGGIVKQAKTNQYGFFEFEKLSNGIYGIIVDMPGLELDSIRIVEITDTDTLHTDQDYEVDSTGIHAGDFTSINEDQYIFNSIVFPNPARGSLYLHFSNLDWESIQIDLINVNGQSVYENSIHHKGELTEQIDVSAHAPGIYLLKLQGGNSLKIVKVLLN